MNVRTLVKHLWMPVAVVALFAISAMYEQQIFLQLGLATYQQLRSIVPYTIQIGIWLSMAYLVTRIADVTIWDPIGRRVAVPKLLRDVTRVIVYSLAISGIVSVVFKKDVSPLWTATGATGIVLGLALRNVIVDVFMGLTMNFDRPFEIGDYIQVANGPTGKVVELNWRTTRILTSDANLAVIPNGKLGDLTVINLSRPNRTFEAEFVVTLDSSVPADRAVRVLTAAAMSVAGLDGVLEEPAPKARIKGFTGVGVEYKVKYFVDPRLGGPGKARHAVMRSVLDQLHHAGLHLAVNKQEMITGSVRARHQDPSSIADRATLLERTDIFATLDPKAREHLAVRMQQRVVAAGERVVGAGEPGASMYVIFEGLLHAEVPSTDGKSTVRVGRLGAGSFFGEFSALTGEPRSASVTAACESLLFEIQKDAFASLVATNPDVLEILTHAIVARRSRTADALAHSDAAGANAEDQSFARQLIAKMRSFFRIGADMLGRMTPRSGGAVPDSASVAAPDGAPELPQPTPSYTRR